MNPEAIEWLENLPPEGRQRRFTPAISSSGSDGTELFSLKDDHERCPFCRAADRRGQLVVIG